MAPQIKVIPLTPDEIATLKAWYLSHGEVLTQTSDNPRRWGVTYQGQNKGSNLADSDLADTYNAGIGGGTSFGSTLGIPDPLNPGSPGNQAANGVAGAVTNVTSTVQSVGQFLGNLANPNLWVRVGEFAIGGILLGIAINGILKNPAGRAASSIKAGAGTAAFPAKAIGGVVSNSAKKVNKAGTKTGHTNYARDSNGILKG